MERVMAKAPPQIPADVGDRVALRGRGGSGVVMHINGTWMRVTWQSPKPAGAAEICHAYELKLLAA